MSNRFQPRAVALVVGAVSANRGRAPRAAWVRRASVRWTRASTSLAARATWAWAHLGWVRLASAHLGWA
jgi:hypothetical protein